MYKATLLALLACVIGAGVARADEVPVPQLNARVTDLTQTLTSSQQQTLENKLAAFEQTKGSQIAILILPTTKPEAIEQYSIRVVEKWKLGRKNVDDGALLLIAKEDRTMRIDAGYGLEGVLTDARSKQIIDDTIVPFFKQGDFYGGVDAGVTQIIRVIEGEPLPPPRSSSSARPAMHPEYLIFGIVLVFILGNVLRSVLGRTWGALTTGVVAGGIAWFMAFSIGIVLVVAILALLSVLFNIGRGGPGGWGTGGYGGGSGWGGGSSGGGFSGGGGGFGGGGASGRW